jgi:hypothetical protein
MRTKIKKFTKQDINNICSKISVQDLFDLDKNKSKQDEIKNKDSKWIADINYNELKKYANWILDYYELNIIAKLNPYRGLLLFYHDYDDNLYPMWLDEAPFEFFDEKIKYTDYFPSMSLEGLVYDLMSMVYGQMNNFLPLHNMKGWSFERIKEAFEEATYYTDQYYIDME